MKTINYFLLSMGFWAFLFFPLISQVEATETTVAIPAISANNFLNSIGACSAISVRGEKLEQTIEKTKYLGLRWYRVAHGENYVKDLIELHKQTGARFSYCIGSGRSNIEGMIKGARQLAEAGALIAIEGNNEPNNWGITYQGEKGGRNSSWVPVAKLQRDLYKAVKSDPLLKDIPVWNITESGAEIDNVGLQFLTVPSDADTVMPAGTVYADYANCHNYMIHPSWPGIHDNQTWIAADPSPACKVDGLYGNYSVTWRKKFKGYDESELASLPRVTTETGVKLNNTITETDQALFYMSVYLDQFKRGWSYTSIYLLRDRSDEAGNQTFGFYKPDYTPRLAAKYLHNLTTILADKDSDKAPGKLVYSIPNQPETVHDMLLQKQDGKFALVVWGERFTGGEDHIAVKLGNAFESIKVYDPTVGLKPVQTLNKTDTISLSLMNHPLVVELQP